MIRIGKSCSDSVSQTDSIYDSSVYPLISTVRPVCGEERPKPLRQAWTMRRLVAGLLFTVRFSLHEFVEAHILMRWRGWVR